MNPQLASIEINKNASNLSEPQPSNLSFEKLLLEAVDEVFLLLGVLSKETVYLHLVEVFGIKKHEIPYKIEEFVSAIEKIFGLGAKILQIQILSICTKRLGAASNITQKMETLS